MQKKQKNQDNRENVSDSETLRLNVLDYLNKKKKISKESFLKKEYTITKLDKIAVLKMDKPKRNLKKSYEEIDNKKPGEHDK